MDRKQRRSSILKVRAPEDIFDENGEQVPAGRERRVSFHNVKHVKKYDKEGGNFLHSSPLREKITDTMDSDGILTPRGQTFRETEPEEACQTINVFHKTSVDMSIEVLNETKRTVCDMSIEESSDDTLKIVDKHNLTNKEVCNMDIEKDNTLTVGPDDTMAVFNLTVDRPSTKSDAADDTMAVFNIPRLPTKLDQTNRNLQDMSIDGDSLSHPVYEDTMAIFNMSNRENLDMDVDEFPQNKTKASVFSKHSDETLNLEKPHAPTQNSTTTQRVLDQTMDVFNLTQRDSQDMDIDSTVVEENKIDHVSYNSTPETHVQSSSVITPPIDESSSTQNAKTVLNDTMAVFDMTQSNSQDMDITGFNVSSQESQYVETMRGQSFMDISKHDPTIYHDNQSVDVGKLECEVPNEKPQESETISEEGSMDISQETMQDGGGEFIKSVVSGTDNTSQHMSEMDLETMAVENNAGGEGSFIYEQKEESYNHSAHNDSKSATEKTFEGEKDIEVIEQQHSNFTVHMDMEITEEHQHLVENSTNRTVGERTIVTEHIRATMVATNVSVYEIPDIGHTVLEASRFEENGLKLNKTIHEEEPDVVMSIEVEKEEAKEKENWSFSSAIPSQSSKSIALDETNTTMNETLKQKNRRSIEMICPEPRVLKEIRRRRSIQNSFLNESSINRTNTSFVATSSPSVKKDIFYLNTSIRSSPRIVNSPASPVINLPFFDQAVSNIVWLENATTEMDGLLRERVDTIDTQIQKMSNVLPKSKLDAIETGRLSKLTQDEKDVIYASRSLAEIEVLEMRLKYAREQKIMTDEKTSEIAKKIEQNEKNVEKIARIAEETEKLNELEKMSSWSMDVRTLQSEILLLKEKRAEKTLEDMRAAARMVREDQEIVEEKQRQVDELTKFIDEMDKASQIKRDQLRIEIDAIMRS